jgi:hypothetical protein
MFNVSGHYMDGERENVFVRERDLIVFNSDITDLTDQLIEYNPTGPQKLHHKALGIEHVRDSHGNIYTEGQDYGLSSQGTLIWLSGRRPTFQGGKGDILTVLYWFNPIYVVVQRPHTIRVLPSNDLGNGAFPRNKVYAPQLLTVRPSTAYAEGDILQFADIPPAPAYASSSTTTGGSI